jgi:hypothetical protein
VARPGRLHGPGQERRRRAPLATGRSGGDTPPRSSGHRHCRGDSAWASSPGAPTARTSSTSRCWVRGPCGRGGRHRSSRLHREQGSLRSGSVLGRYWDISPSGASLRPPPTCGPTPNWRAGAPPPKSWRSPGKIKSGRDQRSWRVRRLRSDPGHFPEAAVSGSAMTTEGVTILAAGA